MFVCLLPILTATLSPKFLLHHCCLRRMAILCLIHDYCNQSHNRSNYNSAVIYSASLDDKGSVQMKIYGKGSKFRHKMSQNWNNKNPKCTHPQMKDNCHKTWFMSLKFNFPLKSTTNNAAFLHSPSFLQHKPHNYKPRIHKKRNK